jgi:hypothetical protein
LIRDRPFRDNGIRERIEEEHPWLLREEVRRTSGWITPCKRAKRTQLGVRGSSSCRLNCVAVQRLRSWDSRDATHRVSTAGHHLPAFQELCYRVACVKLKILKCLQNK